MKFAFILVEKAHYPVLVLCRVLGVSTSGFYAWMRRPRSRRAAEDGRLGAVVAASHARSRRTYGRPRILADLRAQGERVSGKRVARLMRQKWAGRAWGAQVPPSGCAGRTSAAQLAPG